MPDRMLISPAVTSNTRRRLISSQQYQYSDVSVVSQVSPPSLVNVLQVTFSLTGQRGENEDMFDRLVESGQFGGSTDAETETNFVTVSDEDTIDISHVSLSSSCSQKQVF